MSDIAIRVEDLGKEYIIGHQKENDLRNSLVKKIRSLMGKQYMSSESFYALKNISFEIKKGEAIGIIGRNGAGKSTLLKILSRITYPSSGRFEINGTVSSLLEVGTGFHPELSGRENIYLNGTILGMKRAEIKTKFDEIVAFSGVEKFIDTPVKHYSSGMKVRLAFSVAAHLEPEILIVDEVLAVGDAEFQKKCLGKMDEVSKDFGRTILFVSHNLAAVENLCTRALLLNEGNMIKAGAVIEVLKHYQNLFTNNSYLDNQITIKNRKEDAYFKSIHLEIKGSQPSYKLELSCEIISQSNHKDAFLAFDISNSIGVPILQAIPTLEPFLKYSKQSQHIKVEIDLPALIPDLYKVSAWIGSHNTETICWEKEIIGFEINDSPTKGRSFPHSHGNGFLIPSSRIIYG